MKTIFFVLILIFSQITFSQEFTDYDYFASPFNIAWRSEELPKDAQLAKDFKNWKRETYDYPIRWAYVKITNKDNAELVIQETVGGTGGLSTLVMRKNNNKWEKLIDIFGGFIFFNIPSKSNTLIVFNRSGADYKNEEFKLIGNRYKLISTREIPYEISQRNSQDDYYGHFWFMTNGKFLTIKK